MESGTKAKGKLDSQYSRKTNDIREARNNSGFFGSKGNKSYKAVQKQQQIRMRGRKGV